MSGRAFTRRMYDQLKLKDTKGQSLKQHHHVQLNHGFLQDAKMWLVFLNLAKTDHSLLCRPFVDLGKKVWAKDLGFYTDALLNPNFGLGGIFGHSWICKLWGRDFIMDNHPSIEFLELFALTAGILTWGHRLANMRVSVFCDNESVKNMVNNSTSHCSQCMKLIRLIVLDNIKHNRRIFVKHVRSETKFSGRFPFQETVLQVLKTGTKDNER